MGVAVPNHAVRKVGCSGALCSPEHPTSIAADVKTSDFRIDVVQYYREVRGLRVDGHVVNNHRSCKEAAAVVYPNCRLAEGSLDAGGIQLQVNAVNDDNATLVTDLR